MKNLLRFNFLALIYVSLIILSPIKSNAQRPNYSHLSTEEKENKCLELIEQAEYMVEGYLTGYECQDWKGGEIVYKFNVNHWYKGDGPSVINLVNKLDTIKSRYNKNGRSYKNLVSHANYILLINRHEDKTNYKFTYSDSLTVLGTFPNTPKFDFYAAMQYGLRFDSLRTFNSFLKKIEDIQIKPTQNTPKSENETDYFFRGKKFNPKVKQPKLLSERKINLFIIKYMERNNTTFNWSVATEQVLYSAMVHSERPSITVTYKGSDVTWYSLPFKKKYSLLPCEWLETRDAIIDYVLREESKYRGTKLAISDIIHWRINYTTPNITFSVTDPSLILKLKKHPAVSSVNPSYSPDELTELWIKRAKAKAKNKKD